MENMPYVVELVREFLVFRGFTSTLQAFEKELATDIGKGFQPDKIIDLIFSVYIPKYQAENLVNLLSFFKKCFSSFESELLVTLSKLDTSILRYFIVHAIQSGRKDKVVEFFEVYGSDLLHNDQEWAAWFAIPYLDNPHLESQFRFYFSKEWFSALHLSIRNLLNKMFNVSRIPTLLKISSERVAVNHLKNDNKLLNLKLSQLQALLEEKEAQLRQSRSNVSSANELGDCGASSSSHSVSVIVGQTSPPNLSSASYDGHAVEKNADAYSSVSSTSHLTGNVERKDCQTSQEAGYEMQREEEYPEVNVEFQETFLGHTSPITRCRFSASGENVASASVDGTVRIWTYESSTPSTRNATIYCGAEIMSLEWDCKSDRLLLIGTADGGIKAWNADSKRVVCDLTSAKSFPSIVDLKCSPVEPVFVSAAASRGHGSSYIDKLGFASLTVWNMRTWKAMTVLPLGEDPPAITSLCFNHNGKLLAAAATDGMIHMFDMSSGLQVTGWPAHDSAISSILFGSDETSIFSLGIDGKIFEWSLQNQGKILWSKNCSRFYDSSSSLHEMALDASGRRLLVTSSSVRAPIYHVQSCTGGMRTLPHTASITTVDWHPTLPIFLTGSADHSVRVTSIS